MGEPQWEQKSEAIQMLHARAGVAFFSKDPYVKLLPLVFFPPRFEWQRTGSCAYRSDRCLVIPAFGRDSLSCEGWLRFAILAAYSLLCCGGIERYSICILLGESHAGPVDPSCVFDGDFTRQVAELEHRNVIVRRVADLHSAADVYGPWLPPSDIVIRCDADSGFLPAVLSLPAFSFSGPLGYSTLNHRHTGRSGLEQLLDPEDGRMRTWPRDLQVPEDAFLQAVCQAVQAAHGVRLTPAALRAAMTERHWPSEGFSYISQSAIPAFRSLRHTLVSECIVPQWDEEVVKLILSCAQGWPMEPARAEVLEYWEYGLTTPLHSVINFRNQRRIGTLLDEVLGEYDCARSHLRYVQAFFEDLAVRAS